MDGYIVDVHPDSIRPELLENLASTYIEFLQIQPDNIEVPRRNSVCCLRRHG